MPFASNLVTCKLSSRWPSLMMAWLRVTAAQTVLTMLGNMLAIVA